MSTRHSLSQLSLFITLACAMLILSCKNDPAKKLSGGYEVSDSLEVDVMTGSTALGDLDDMSDMTDLVWTTPHSKLKSYLALKDFCTDTTRLKQLASYAYKDLRRSSFLPWQHELLNRLDKGTHSMGDNSSLIKGVGYYYAQKDSLGNFSGVDLGFEHWKVDTTNAEKIVLLIDEWKESYHPMPFYTVQHEDHLYVLYTRSVQFAPFLDSCVNELKSF